MTDSHHHISITSQQQQQPQQHHHATQSQQSQQQQQDITRHHVIQELVETERSYVESLDILVNKYMLILKSSENHQSLIESSQVDVIFNQIPEMLRQHESFLNLLDQRISSFTSPKSSSPPSTKDHSSPVHPSQNLTSHLQDLSQVTIGDVLIDAFTKEPMSETYICFINNWKNANEAIKSASSSKAGFSKFLESMSREHKGKLTLDALLIMPVQRIPRYELLLKELIKHTTCDHPDYHLLQEAQKEVHELALKINQMEKEANETEANANRVKELEHLIEGVIDLYQPDRSFIRYDFVTIPGGLGIKKDRCLFLFSDLLLITSIKRKSGGVSRKSSAQAALASAQFAASNSTQ